MSESSRQPLLSVIIASYNAHGTITRCLQALENQTVSEGYEVIVVDSSGDGVAELIADRFPDVRLYTFPERLFPGDARNFGIANAQGEILAFTDADCVVEADWVEEIIKAHQTATPVIGGVITNGNPENYVGWAHYFCTLSQWMPQSGTRRMAEIPTGCLSIKRWVFDRYGPFLEGTLCSDSAFHWQMNRDGHHPLLIPTIRVAHTNSTRLWPLLKKLWRHGRYYAGIRAVEHRFSNLRRFVYILGAPVLPPLLLCRTAFRVVRHRNYTGPFLLTLPLVFVGFMAWSWGELLGYLTPPARE